MKTPPDMMHARMRKPCRQLEPGTFRTIGLLMIYPA